MREPKTHDPLLQRLPPGPVELWRASTPRASPRQRDAGGARRAGRSSDLLLTGRATYTVDTANRRSIVLDRLTAPAVLDEVATYSGGDHPGSVTTTSDAWWCQLPRETLEVLLDQHPGARRHVLALLTRAAGRARATFVDVATRPSLSRLAAWLLATAHTDQVTLPRPQDRLAQQRGMTRVTLNAACSSSPRPPSSPWTGRP